MRLERRLKALIQTGRLTVIMPDGQAESFGEASPPPHLDVVVQLSGRRTPSKLARNPHRELGEAYVSGQLAIRRGSVAALMALLFLNLHRDPPGWSVWDRLHRAWVLANEQQKTAGDDRSAAALRHRDNAAVYRAFLGDERQFSIAYFDHPYTSLDRAQAAARRHLAAKLQLKPGQKVLDVGCGWGALAIWLAQTFDVQVTGYALAADQMLHAQEAVRRAALSDRVQIRAGDFRRIEGEFDRIVVIGSFEHVGTPQYLAYLQALKAALAPEGLILLHSTGRIGPPRPLNPWVRHRLFPGSHAPSLDEAAQAIEKASLWITDLEILRLHGAETLRLWRERLEDEGDMVSDVDDSRWRTWELFLAGAEMAFRYGDLVTFEAQLAKSVTAAPITRNYIAEAEAALADREAHLGAPPHPTSTAHARAESGKPRAA